MSEGTAVDLEVDGDEQVGGVRAVGFDEGADSLVGVGLPPKLRDMDLGDYLDPDGLPDSRGPLVPHLVRVRLPRLLAARLAFVTRVILGPHNDGVRCRLPVECVSDVQREGGLAPVVVSDVVAVDPDVCAVVDCAEVQKHARACRRQPRWQLCGCYL